MAQLTASEFIALVVKAETEIVAWNARRPEVLKIENLNDRRVAELAGKMPARRAKKAVEAAQHELTDEVAEELGNVAGMQERLEAVCGTVL